MPEEKLEPCPFCGDSLSTGTYTSNWDHWKFAVGCSNCGINGPDGDDKAEAAELWNKREPDHA